MLYDIKLFVFLVKGEESYSFEFETEYDMYLADCLQVVRYWSISLTHPFPQILGPSKSLTPPFLLPTVGHTCNMPPNLQVCLLAYWK